MTNDVKAQGQALLAAHKKGGRPLAEAFGVLANAIVYAAVPGSQKKKQKVFRAIWVEAMKSGRRILTRRPKGTRSAKAARR